MDTSRHAFPQNISSVCGILRSGSPCLSTKSAETEVWNDEVGDEYIKAMSRCWVELTSDERTELWMSIFEQEGVHKAATSNYHNFLETPISSRLTETIEKDLARTYPNHDLFSAGNGQPSMRNVLHAYAAYDPELGYCQGMNFLVGILLMYLPCEDKAFGAIVFLMQERGLRDLYTESMTLLQLRLWQLSRLMPKHLTSHLESLGVVPVLFASSWFLTCFAASFPQEIAARVLDVVLWNDLRTFMLKFAYTLIVGSVECISSMDSTEEVLDFLTHHLSNKKIAELHDLVSQAFVTPWSEEHRLVLECATITESVYDSITRVEDALTSGSVLTTQEQHHKRRKGHCFKQTLPRIGRFLTRTVVISLRHLSVVYKSTPIKQVLKKL